jgi:uncharacterized membrane protein YfcA
MLAGYPYFEVLSLTLPTSFIISLSQVGKYYKHINWYLVKKALLFTIPIIPIGMLVAGYLGAMVGIVMGIFLFFTSFGIVAQQILPPNASSGRLSTALFVMGLIHGTTNLGGDILPSVVNQKCALKEQKLATTAAIYIMFQVTQISFILIKRYPIDISRSGICVLIGFFAYAIIGRKLFQYIKSDGYTRYLRYFIRLVAVMLISIKIYNLK